MKNPIQHAEGALVGPRMQMQPGDARSVYSRSFVGSWALQLREPRARLRIGMVCAQAYK
jgi:hypothetical protein